MRSQALGLAEAAGLQPAMLTLRPHAAWSWMPARFWPTPLHAARLPVPDVPLIIGCGGKPAPVLAALRRMGKQTIQIQHPRMDPRRFSAVVVTRR